MVINSIPRIVAHHGIAGYCTELCYVTLCNTLQVSEGHLVFTVSYCIVSYHAVLWCMVSYCIASHGTAMYDIDKEIPQTKSSGLRVQSQRSRRTSFQPEPRLLWQSARPWGRLGTTRGPRRRRFKVRCLHEPERKTFKHLTKGSG